jgi:hypothetical protein
MARRCRHPGPRRTRPHGHLACRFHALDRGSRDHRLWRDLRLWRPGRHSFEAGRAQGPRGGAQPRHRRHVRRALPQARDPRLHLGAPRELHRGPCRGAPQTGAGRCRHAERGLASRGAVAWQQRCRRDSRTRLALCRARREGRAGGEGASGADQRQPMLGGTGRRRGVGCPPTARNRQGNLRAFRRGVQSAARGL